MTDTHNNSSSNKSNISDENKNTLNNSNDNLITTNKITNNISENKKEVGNLKLFFINKDLNDINNEISENKNYTDTEYKKVVDEILKNEQGDKFLEGKSNILDKVILKYSNIKNISQIKQTKSIKLTIDKNFGMLNDIGYYLPNLIELNLEGSEVSSILDIGISFENLLKLNVSKCKLFDLSGIVCFKKLEELNASNNMIRDLIDLEMCTEIKILNLSNNNIEDEDNLYFLNSFEKLEKVNLNGNPIANKIKSNKELKDILNNSIQIILD